MSNSVLDNTRTGRLSDGSLGEASLDSFLSDSGETSDSSESGAWRHDAAPQVATANSKMSVRGGVISQGLSVTLFGYSIWAVVLMSAFMIIGLMVSSLVLNF